MHTTIHSNLASKKQQEKKDFLENIYEVAFRT